MPTHAARQAYSIWILADTRYQQARSFNEASPATGAEKEKRAQQLAGLAKTTKDAWDEYQKAMQEQ